MLRKERIWNYMSKYKHKMQIKEERQKWEQRQQIGNSNKYGRCKSNYIKITLNSNSLNTPVERQRFSEWIDHSLFSFTPLALSWIGLTVMCTFAVWGPMVGNHPNLSDNTGLLNFTLHLDIAMNLWFCTSLCWVFNTVFVFNINQSWKNMLLFFFTCKHLDEQKQHIDSLCTDE